jgi:Na+-driven multidrug efflux pump
MVFLMITLGGGFSVAGTILVAQYRGKGDLKQVDHVVGQTVVMMFLISILASIIGYASAEPMMKLLGAAPEVCLTRWRI